MVALLATLSGCSTINSIPYNSSVDNVVSIQEAVMDKDSKITLGAFDFANGISGNLTCRLLGPVKVQPENMAKYIQTAFKEELFRAGVYSSSSENVMSGIITKLDFSSAVNSRWEIGMKLSGNGISYNTEIVYPFTSSFDAYSACKNTANAFSGAVQKLIKEAVLNPKFSKILK